MSYDTDSINFRNVREALCEYEVMTRTESRNEDYCKACKNIDSFNQFKNKIFLVTTYLATTPEENVPLLMQSPGLVVFYDTFLAYASKRGFSHIQGKIDYSRIDEMSVISAENFLMKGSLILFLSYEKKCSFTLGYKSAGYIAFKLTHLSYDANIPFYPIVPGVNSSSQKIEKGRLIFLNRNK